MSSYDPHHSIIEHITQLYLDIFLSRFPTLLPTLTHTLMELEMYLKVIGTLCLAYVVVTAWRILNWVWIRPKRLEKVLRNQGFKGNPYRLLYGDVKELAAARKEARTKPISLSDDIIPRVTPTISMPISKHGKKSFLWLGPRPAVYITDPNLIKEVLNKTSNFQKPRGGNPLFKLLANGLASAEGETWAKHRKIMNPAFHFEKLKDMLPAMYLSCSEIVSKWEEMVSTEGQCEVDVWPYLGTLTADVISRTAFGSSYEEGRQIFQLQKEQAGLLMQAAQTLYLPGMRFLPTKRIKRMKHIDSEVRSALRSMINKRMKAMQAQEYIQDDLLGLLLKSNSEEIIENKNIKYGMSVDEIIEECKLFYFAGQETTSNLLTWAMVLLSQHSYWQERAREEVLQAFEKNKPDLDGLNRLKVVNMILLESLRLYPPALFLSRGVYEDIKLGDIFLPAGVSVQLPIILMHHDKESWGDDAKEFNPERFSEGVSKATKGKGVFFPFGLGPRICIGQNFAMLEAKMALSMILQRFSFVLSPSYTHAPHAVLTIQPQHGANLILKAL